MSVDKGLRYNEGKIRYDLITPFALEQLATVLSKGAEKYAERNWELGMRWSTVIASLERHLQAFKNGEDFDKESGLLHISHLLTNAAFLAEYYKIYPQGDDRQHQYLSQPKIGLDIDEVLAAWVPSWSARWKIDVPKSWYFDRHIAEKFKEMEESGELYTFYLDLPVLTDPDSIPFEPHCYVTSRPIPVEYTEEWLDKNGFPQRPVYCVGIGNSKVDVIKESGCEVFVDDRFDNFVELNKAGICTFLFDAPHNQRYDVGYKRIKNLKELMQRTFVR